MPIMWRGLLRRFWAKNDKISKTVNGSKHGVSIAQDIAREYNKLAQWLALPQVPDLFLKKEDRKA